MESTEHQDLLRESQFYFEQGEAQLRAKNFDVAISCFEECARLAHPFFKATSLLKLAALYRMTAQEQKEAETLNRIAGLPENEKKFLPHATLAIVLAKLGKLEEAAEEYNQVLKMQPSDVGSILNFAELQIVRSRYAQALELTDRLRNNSEPKVMLMLRFFSLVIATVEKHVGAQTQALVDFIDTVKKVGVPADFQWDFSDIEPAISKIREANDSQILAKVIGLLQRQVPVDDFLKEFAPISSTSINA